MAQVLVHIRFPEELIKQIDAHAEKMQAEARKIVPGIEIGRAESISSLVTLGLATSKEKRK